MIRVTCPNCSASFETDDANAGKTGRCPNCQSPLRVPAAQSAEASPSTAMPDPAVAAQAVQPNQTTVVVQVPAAQQAPGRIGPSKKSVAVSVLLWLLPIAGLPYFYIGQTGKGLLFLLLDIFLWGPLFFLTCGLALIGYIPANLVMLIDAIIVTSRVRKSSVHRWRFF